MRAVGATCRTERAPRLVIHTGDPLGLNASNTTPQWQRIREHTIRALAPQASPITALAVDAADVPDVEIANAFGVLLTE